MTHKHMKASLLALAMVCVAGAAQAEMTLAVPPGAESQILIGGIATRYMQIEFTAPFSFAAGGLRLTFDAGLSFLPEQSTIDFGNLFSGSFSQARTALNAIALPDGGGCGVSADFLYSYCASFGMPGQVGLSVTLPPPPKPPATDMFEMRSQQVQLKLVFQGNAVGNQAISYELDALSNDLSQTPAFSGDFDAIRVQAIPEPATYALMLGGLLAVGVLARRRRCAV